MRHNGKPSLSEAKASFSASMDEVHPLKSALQIHPLLTLGAIVAVGALLGFTGTKTLKKTGSLAVKTLSAPALPLAIIKKFFL